MSRLETARPYSGSIILLKQNIWYIFFTDLANTLISERVGNATGGCDVMDLILTNKDETEVMEIVLTGCANAILGSLVMTNMLATVRYMKLDII